MQKNKGIMHFLMIVLILIWTFDTVSISLAVKEIPQITLLCMKYLSALPIVCIAAYLTKGLRLPEKKDRKRIVLSGILGCVLYAVIEYTAIKHLPISISTVLIGILPAVSYLTDCVIEKRRIRFGLLSVILLSLVGLGMVVRDHSETTGGDMLGVICCFLCVVIWVLYGLLVRRLEKNYSSESLTLYNLTTAVIIFLPYVLLHPPAGLSMKEVLMYIILPGMLSGGLGGLIEVKGLMVLGTTVIGVYLNLLPVFTVAAGFLFLHEELSLLQITGSVIVILCGLYITAGKDV